MFSIPPPLLLEASPFARLALQTGPSALGVRFQGRRRWTAKRVLVGGLYFTCGENILEEKKRAFFANNFSSLECEVPQFR